MDSTLNTEGSVCQQDAKPSGCFVNIKVRDAKREEQIYVQDLLNSQSPPATEGITLNYAQLKKSIRKRTSRVRKMSRKKSKSTLNGGISINKTILPAEHSKTPNTNRSRFVIRKNKIPIQNYFHKNNAVDRNIKRLKINNGIRKLLQSGNLKAEKKGSMTRSLKLNKPIARRRRFLPPRTTKGVLRIYKSKSADKTGKVMVMKGESLNFNFGEEDKDMLKDTLFHNNDLKESDSKVIMSRYIQDSEESPTTAQILMKYYDSKMYAYMEANKFEKPRRSGIFSKINKSDIKGRARSSNMRFKVQKS
ncbi:unnamed protein product [Moneuplotes crassus]|uniref:Uncharacterized protein n=1 Tax=Euplotes crassus TaxID=5936 RepID=A0AAD1XJ02_EUPCR|nr:unnamed protein product [Moneuplotes crassus]